MSTYDRAMTNAAVVGRLLPLLARVAGADRTPADAGPETPLREGGFWLDSVALLELIVAAETEFGVEFDPTRDFEEAPLRTVGSFAACIGARLAGP
jgi:acyl carrier protein